VIGGYPPAGPDAPPPELGPPPPPPAMPAEPPHLAMRMSEIEWSARTQRALDSANITTVRELVQRTESELLNMNDIGRQQLSEVKEILANMGLSLGMRL
jgi:DNA-directed RNA polymerase alpha subunit